MSLTTLPNASSFVWGFLSDGTPQFWASSDLGNNLQIYTKLRSSPTSGAWTAWINLDNSSGFVPVSAVLNAPSGVLLYASNIGTREISQSPENADLDKVPGNSPNAAAFGALAPRFPNPATPQNPNPSGLANFSAAVTGKPTDTSLPVVCWATDTAGGLWQALVSAQGQAAAEWSSFPPPTTAGTPVKVARVWPLNGPGDDQPVPSGSKPGWPVWAIGEQGTLWWCQATFVRSPNGTLIGPTWTPWTEFPVQLAAGLSVTALAAAQLEDGRIQMFAGDNKGNLWSIWQIEGQAGTWRDGWKSIALPGGSANTLATAAPPQGQTIALGQLPEGNLQLFVVDNTATIQTMWKQSNTDPDAGWTDWQPF